MKLDHLKQASIQTALRIVEIEGDKSRRVIRQLNCANQLEYALEKGSLEMYLNRANFCNNRECCVCNWRKSSKKRIKVFPGIKRYIENFSVIPLFLTLTLKNCHFSDLRHVILHQMQPAWERFRHRRVFLGFAWFKSLEVTRPRHCYYKDEFIGTFGIRQIKIMINSGEFDINYWHEEFSEECHPHYHVLLFVGNEYFLSGNYLPQSEWVAQWKSALRVTYDPVVDIRRIYSDNKSLDKAILETTKYCLKPTDMTDSLAPYIFRQLHGLRLNSVGGELRRYINEGDLLRIDKSGIAGNEFYQYGISLTYEWDIDDEFYKIIKFEVD